MSDRELLELAAKAAGIEIKGYTEPPYGGDPVIHFDCQTITAWNPLTDDGDALRLAVKLGLMLRNHGQSERFGGFVNVVGYDNKDGFHDIYEDHKGDEYASARRAIVRAAAEIGKAMQ